MYVKVKNCGSTGARTQGLSLTMRTLPLSYRATQPSHQQLFTCQPYPVLMSQTFSAQFFVTYMYRTIDINDLLPSIYHSIAFLVYHFEETYNSNKIAENNNTNVNGIIILKTTNDVIIQQHKLKTTLQLVTRTKKKRT